MANVTFGFNPLPAPACYPPDFNGLAQELTTGGVLTGTIPDTAGGGVFVGSAAPSSSLTNKVWFKVDSAGRPLGVYMFYNGNWRKVYTATTIGEIRTWGGGTSVFDGTGRGLVGGDLDGWALCNGSNGTFNLKDRFIISGEWSGSGWVTGVTGAQTSSGGQATISASNLPALQTPTFGVLTGPTTGGTGAYLGAENAAFQNYWRVRDGSGNVVGLNNPYLPPYIALGYIQFVGYA